MSILCCNVVSDHNHLTPAVIQYMYAAHVIKSFTYLQYFITFLWFQPTGQDTVTLLMVDDDSAIVKVKPTSLVIPEESLQADKIVSFGQLLDCFSAGFDSQKVVTLYLCLPSVWPKLGLICHTVYLTGDIVTIHLALLKWYRIPMTSQLPYTNELGFAIPGDSASLFISFPSSH